MTIRAKNLIVALIGVGVAVGLAPSIADGNFGWPATIAVAASLLAVWRATGLAADIVLSGLVVCGYLIGNRGFAQLTYPGIPLFPAEALLALGIISVIVRRGPSGTLPFPPGTFSKLLVLWLAICTARLCMDVRVYRFAAVRDYALAYYALFFFLAYDWMQAPRARVWLHRCTVAGLAIAPITFELFRRFPDAVTKLQLAGAPLIFIKSDSAAALMAGGAAWTGALADRRRHWGYGLLSMVLIVATVFSNSRAALLALVVLLLWLMAGRYWRLLKAVAACALLGLVLLGGQAVLSARPWYDTELYRNYERLLSIADFSGEHVYRNPSLQDKGDNNEFRRVWWATVWHETMDSNPWLGNGFGYDLTTNFVRAYYPTADEEFYVRSPHNVLLTLFGRVGALGAGSFLLVLFALGRETWRALRRDDENQFGLMLFAWAVIVSACFGVVLEGPMGAVPCWIVLGWAAAVGKPTSVEDDGGSPEKSARQSGEANGVSPEERSTLNV
jgi:O-antigen ligase